MRVYPFDPRVIQHIHHYPLPSLPPSLPTFATFSCLLTPASLFSSAQPFPGVVEALKECPYPVYIASSKAGHRVSALMQAVMGVELPEDSPRLYASLLP